MDMLHRRCNGKHEHQCIEGLVRVGGRWANRSTRPCHRFTPNSWLNSFVRLVWSEKKQQHVHEVHEAIERFLGNMNMSMTVVLVNLGTTRALNRLPSMPTYEDVM